jgi:hypothetical protein
LAGVEAAELHLRRPQFGFGRIGGGQPASVEFDHAAVDERLSHRYFGGDIGEREPRVLQGPDGLTKGGSFANIVDGPAQARTRTAQAAHGDLHAFLRKVSHQIVEPAAHFTQHIVLRHRHVGEHQF